MDEDIKKLVEENLRLTQEMHAKVVKTANYIKWLRVMDALKVLLILIPLVAAWLYVPRLLDYVSTAYGNFLPGSMLK